MNLLIIDTSTQALYVAAYYRGNLFEFYENDLKNKHSETLLSKLDSLLVKNDISISEIDYFCAAAGPGSFTGIRIGVTTVRAFAQVYGKPVIAVNSLELKAYNIGIKGIVIPLIFAVQGKYYIAAYLNGKEIVPPFMCNTYEIENLKDKLQKQYGYNAFFIHETEIEKLKEVIKPKQCDYLGYCMQKAREGLFTDYNGIVPVYAALSQAEIEYECKHTNMD